MLSDAAILALRGAGEIEIVPFAEAQLKPGSYVLRLGGRFRRWVAGEEPIRMWSPDAAASALEDPVQTDRLRLEPGDFVLGCTLEKIGLSGHLAAEMSPLSHVARFGLGVTGGANFVNPGHGERTPSHLTLELFNHGMRALELDAGMPIAHLRLTALSGASWGARQRSIYEGADPLIAPLLYEEWRDRLRGDA